ncbi:hypothetical protein LZC95_39620 [Pendulispora brunnea]|uniref:Isoquinoline 1-oxidoreductase subunit n=1 Tax=Pendulispora brunnea TaxID=2905690 RepID=A0ABZ2K4R4_9BACT
MNARVLVAGSVIALGATVGWLGRPERAVAAEPLAEYDVLYRVLLSPRCRNCHPAGDAPLQTDEGIPHAQNITRRSEHNGLSCSTCHRSSNGRLPHTPPGAPHWDLPPAATPMVFQGRTPRQLCEQLKDPVQTNGKDLAALVEHIATDPLVAWGWSPGPGRTLPPVSHERTTEAIRSWVAGGAPCP